MRTMNEILKDIVVALGGSASGQTRNGLLRRWLDTLRLGPNVAPVIFLDPPLQQSNDGDTWRIDCVITNGARNVTYQWLNNAGTPLTGETNSFITGIGSTGVNLQRRCLVTNEVGSNDPDSDFARVEGI